MQRFCSSLAQDAGGDPVRMRSSKSIGKPERAAAAACSLPRDGGGNRDRYGLGDLGGAGRGADPRLVRGTGPRLRRLDFWEWLVLRLPSVLGF